jgi:hypothetical protein
LDHRRPGSHLPVAANTHARSHSPAANTHTRALPLAGGRTAAHTTRALPLTGGRARQLNYLPSALPRAPSSLPPPLFAVIVGEPRSPPPAHSPPPTGHPITTAHCPSGGLNPRTCLVADQLVHLCRQK